MRLSSPGRRSRQGARTTGNSAALFAGICRQACMGGGRRSCRRVQKFCVGGTKVAGLATKSCRKFLYPSTREGFVVPCNQVNIIWFFPRTRYWEVT